MKTPASIVFAVLWLLLVAGFGLFEFTNEFLSSSRNFVQTFWYLWIALVSVVNLVSLILFLVQRPNSHWIYYISASLLLFSGVAIHFFTGSDHDQAAKLAGDFAARCISAILIFTIAYLPYRERFKKTREAEQNAAGQPATRPESK